MHKREKERDTCGPPTLASKDSTALAPPEERTKRAFLVQPRTNQSMVSRAKEMAKGAMPGRLVLLYKKKGGRREERMSMYVMYGGGTLLSRG